MKRGYIIMIAGGALLVAGIAISLVWGISLAGSFVVDSTIIQRAPLSSGQSITATRNVDSIDRSLSLAIGIDQRQSQPDDDFVVRETVTDPNGNIVSRSEFQESFTLTIHPEVTGIYSVTITNIGAEPVTIGGAFGHVPFLGPDGQPNMDELMSSGSLGMIIAGGVMATTGIVVLIAGVVVTIVDGRKRQGTTTTTSEGGITYRKD